MKFIRSILLVCIMCSCHPNVEKSARLRVPEIENKEAAQQKSINAKPAQHTLMEFVEYNNDGDYFLLIAKKGDSSLSFINDESSDTSLLRGDVIDVSWDTTTIEIAGDGDAREQREKIISIVKVKDGNVSTFRMHYQKKLKYTWLAEDSYSQDYLDKLYLLVEYYIANSANELLKMHVKNRDQLSYSIEEQSRNDKKYIMMGISTTEAHHVNTIQWLYLEKEKNILYEYDLPNDSLVRFQ